MNVENPSGRHIPATEKDAYNIAKSIASLTKSLSASKPEELPLILPDFHNLVTLYQQFEEAISQAGIMRLLRATHLISELRQRKNLVTIFNQLSDESSYPTRLIYYDCKMNLQAPMPGKFVSDLGDMIRTMVCPVDENSTAWEAITVRSNYYFAIICGYLDGIGQLLTKEEKEHLHFSGLLITYQQTLRFVTDFLDNDTFYHTNYPEQNLNRALNQYILLEQLEEFLEKKYHVTVSV